MEGAMPNTPLDREEDKKEIFARVWKRVMGDHTDACPITWEETGGDQAQTTTEQQQTLVTDESAQTEEKTVLPAPHVPGGGQRLHSDFPRSEEHTSELQHPGGAAPGPAGEGLVLPAVGQLPADQLLEQRRAVQTLGPQNPLGIVPGKVAVEPLAASGNMGGRGHRLLLRDRKSVV